MKTLTLYMVSDSSGETVIATSKAAIALFEFEKVIEYMWPLVRKKEHIDELMKDVKKKPGIVIYTIIDKNLREYLHTECTKLNIKCLSPISPLIEAISKYSGVPVAKKKPGKIFSDSTFLKKADNINYAIEHDDGQKNENFNNADILILGVSRTSKTPTSLYLAQRGYKVANWPIINNIEYDLSSITNPLIIGLTISPDRLMQIRNFRFKLDKIKNLDEYLDLFSIKKEITYANNIFKKHNVTTVDVTFKAIEEIAAEIINLFFLKKGEHSINE